MEYDVGQAVTVYIDNIKDPGGTVVDPVDVTLTIRHPNGDVDTHLLGALTHVELGHYRYEQQTSTNDDVGEWAYRFETSTPDTVGEGVFTVRRSIVLGGVSTPRYEAGTCSPWAESGDVGPPCNTYDFDESILDDALQVASDVLYNLTGRRWAGECVDTLRPCGYGTGRTLAPRLSSALPIHPGGTSTGYVTAQWCGCSDSRACGCRRPSEVKLPGYPVRSIQQVRIDGQILDAARYRVDDHRWLVYLPADGEQRRGWPCCQRVDLADTELDTWSITYTYGMSPPLGGQQSAAALACQLAMSRDPSLAAQCRLPKRVTSITRQGISLAVLDPLTLFADGLTGLTEVDMWVQSILLGDKRRRATVHVPGASPRHRRVGR